MFEHVHVKEEIVKSENLIFALHFIALMGAITMKNNSISLSKMDVYIRDIKEISHWAWYQRHGIEQRFCFLLILLLSSRRYGQVWTSCTINVTIALSISQTFRSWVAKSHIRPPIAFYRIGRATVKVCSFYMYECIVLRAMHLSNKLLAEIWQRTFEIVC